MIQYDFSHWQPSTLSPLFRQSIVDIGDNIHLCVEVAGNPEHPPILFVAGLGSHMTFWSADFLEKFIHAGFFVIRFDNRDVGLSSKIQIGGLPRLNFFKLISKVQLGLSNRTEAVAYNLFDMAEDVARLIKTLKLNNTLTVVGVSMGGIIAQILAARYPSYLSKLVLLCSTTNHRFLALPRPKQFATFIRRPESHSERDVVRHSVWFMTAVGTKGHLDIKGTRAIAEERYRRCFHPLGVIQQMHAIAVTGSILRQTKAIKTDTLILHGGKDGLIPVSHGRHLKKHIKHSKLVIIDEMAHDIPAYYQPHLVDLIVRHINNQTI